MANMLIEIQTTRAISQQIIRHRSFSYQEFSQRYAEVSEWEYTQGTRMKGDTNRQGSLPTDDERFTRWWKDIQFATNEGAFANYRQALEYNRIGNLVHYDISKSKRAEAVQLGAIPLDTLDEEADMLDKVCS
jgi:thymidylate synthase ThyX